MFELKQIIIAILCVCFTNVLVSQSVGIRAGLNLSTFSGDLEVGESYDYANGFHFGFNYGYEITNKFTIRAELLYTQIGSRKKYNGPGYYKIYPLDGTPTIFEPGQSILDLEVSNAYINVPILASYRLSKKFEIYGGLSFNFLVNPIGRGTITFESSENPDGILFKQSLDYKYYQDNAREARFSQSRNIGILVEGERIDLPRFAGAYYQFNDVEKSASAYNWFDMTATGGINYFINSGFFIGISAHYGLLDITDNEVDVSLRSLDENNNFILRDDYDVNVSLQASLGFRF